MRSNTNDLHNPTPAQAIMSGLTALAALVFAVYLEVATPEEPTKA